MKSIQEFATKYGNGNDKPVESIIDDWIHQKEVDEFLSTSVGGGVLMGDMLVGDGLQDKISPKLYRGFNELMEEKADTYEKIRAILLSKLREGDSKVAGMINNLQGQIGENEFLKFAEGKARLANLHNQPDWDAVVDRVGEPSQFVQVKIYKDSNQVMQKIYHLQDRLAAGKVKDEAGNLIHKVDYAVSANVYEDVVEKTHAAGFDMKILRIPVNRDEIRGIVKDGFDNVGNEEISNFFDELFMGTLTATALHAMANGFLLYKGAKDRSEWLEDTAISSAISTGGLTAAFTTEALFHKLTASAAFLGGAATTVSSMAVGISARMYLKRIADRRNVVTRLDDDNQQLRELTTQLESV